MARGTGGNPLEGAEKIETNSPEYQSLVEMLADPKFLELKWQPQSFYEAHPDYNKKYTFKALQNAWASAKRAAAGKVRAKQLCTFRRRDTLQ